MSELSPIGGFGPQVDPMSADGTVPPSEPISLEEHDETVPFELSEADAEFLDSMGERYGVAPLGVSFTRDGEAVLESGSHVGVLTLPSGVRVEITPKRTVTRLLWALKYAFDTPVDSLDLETGFTSASSFFDAIGVLFHAELQSVLDQGLHREYVRTNAVQEQVQGRIDVQRQLQRPSAVTTDFAVSYEEFTTDNVLNGAVLTALRVLLTLVSDDALAEQLQRQEQRLRAFASADDVAPAALERIELTRLNEHYGALLELSSMVLEREFFEDARAGSQRSLALFVNMNAVFERIVERAFRAATAELGAFRVRGQASVPNLIEGDHAVSMRPDVLVRTDDGVAVAVADAKWKTGTASSGDIYQLTSYILSLDAAGVLVYPGGRERDAESTVGGRSLHSIGLATDADVASYEAYAAALEASARRYLETVSPGVTQ